MKKLLITIAVVFVFAGLHAQVQDPVKWKYVAIKKSDKEYTINILATLDASWHIYSMNTPNGGPVATTFNFKKNPLVTIDGKTTEVGKLSTVHDEIFGVDVKYYSETVTFAQVVKLKSPVKTNLTGTIKYMVCNDKMCLPPKTVSFNVPIE
jgi:hypothetical protein